MTMVVNRFDAGNPFELDKLNENFQLLIAAINALAADDVLSLGVLVDASPQYMAKTGGAFLGQITAPSCAVGGSPVVTQGTLAATAVAGAVKKALAVADLVTAIGNPPTQAQVTEIRDKINALMASLRAAGLVAT
jgi:hypothetical protein